MQCVARLTNLSETTFVLPPITPEADSLQPLPWLPNEPVAGDVHVVEQHVAGR
jgi:hypothetical protein